MFLVESEQREDHTDLLVFSRDESGEKQVKRVSDFSPYFYVPENETLPDDHRITRVEPGHTSIDGKKLKKIYTKSSRDISNVRNYFSECYEADIRFSQRYIIDEVGEVEPYPLRTMYIDIELNTDVEFPDLENPNQEITCITVVDSFEDKDVTLIYKSPDSNVEIDTSGNVKVFNTEEEMLQYLLVVFNKLDPDIISGWNCEEFDLIYLIRRMNGLGINYRKMSPMNTVYINDDYNDVIIKGRIIMDMMAAYKQYRRTTNQGRASSLSLDNVAKEVLDKEKIKHSETFREMWVEKPNKLIQYNIRDTRLVKEINDKLDVIPFFNSIRCKACAQLSSIYYTSILIDGLILREVHNEKVLPMRKQDMGETYSGAFVIRPEPGLYENVHALDVSGMYPNIMKTFNISYETFEPNGEIKINDYIGFSKDEEGLFPKIIKNLEKERNRYKKLRDESGSDDEWELYEFKQYAIKVLNNSLYGYLGFPKSRLYKKEVAYAVTMLGQTLIRYSQEKLEDWGYDVVYGDTDSVYVQGKEDGLLSLLREGSGLVNKLNDSYKDFAGQFNAENPTLKMEFEKIFKRILFVNKKGSDEGAKKKYAYLPLWIDGKDDVDHVEFTGFGTVRSDVPTIARKTQKKVLEMILRGKTENEVVNYLLEVDKNIRTGKIPDEDVGFPGAMSQNINEYKTSRPVVEAAKYSNKYLGTRYGKGNKPKWIHVKSVPEGYPDTDYICFEDEIPSGFIPDYNRVNKRIFKKKLESIWKSVGWGSFPDVNSEHKKLDEWGI